MGSHVAERLAKNGHDVCVIDNLSRAELLKKNIPSDYNWRFLRRLQNVKLFKRDIRDLASLKTVFADAEFVLHAAGQTAATTALSHPILDFEINALGTLNVLEAARKYSDNATVVYCSTNKVYGDNVDKVPIVEKRTRYEFKGITGIPVEFPTDNCEHSPYGCSKYAGDLYVQEYGKIYGMKTGVFRQSAIYGPRQIGVPDQGWVAWLTIAMVTQKKITIYGTGKQVRDVLYIDDLVEAFLKFKLKASSLKGAIFNIGGGPNHTLSLLELMDLLERMGAPRAKTEFADWRRADQKVYISDINKTKTILKWKPKIGVREGVSRLFEWVKKEKALLM